VVSRSGNFLSVSDICARVKHLGYTTSGRVRLYGEEFEVVSDPFPEAGGIAVHVTTKKDSSIRVLRIPATVVQSAKKVETPLPSSRDESAIVGQETLFMDKSRDQDRGKGALEQDQQNQDGNTNMQGQLGHRDEDADLKSADADLSG
jgi:hypothetical protein